MRKAITAVSAVLISAVACAGSFAPKTGAAQSPPSHTADDQGLRVFKSANCMGCHKWYGGGGGGYGGAALSLRRTQLTRDQIIEVVSCGRPGTGMPYHMRGAYDDVKCYGGVTKAQLGDNIPPEPAHYLRPSDIEAVADYVLSHLKGKGDPTFEECQAFFGTHSRVCDTYPKAAQQTDQAAPRSDVREFRVGMPVSDLPGSGYTAFVCADDPKHVLSGWAGYRECPADASGLHAVGFRYDDSASPRPRLNDSYRGTKVAGHPVSLALLIGNDARVDGIRINTDPGGPLYLRKKAFLFADQVKARYGEQGWTCSDAQPGPDEAPIGGVFVKRHCEKTTDGRHLVLDQELYRHKDQPLRDFVGGTRLTILRAG